MVYIIISIIVVLAAFASIFLLTSSFNRKKDEFFEQIDSQREENSLLKQQLAAKDQLIASNSQFQEQLIAKGKEREGELLLRISQIESNHLKQLKDRETEWNRLQKESKTELGGIFENIAAKILEEKSSNFLQNSSREVARIIEPFTKEISEFKSRIEQQYIDQTKEQSTLKGELSKLFDLNNKLGEEANSLVKAIKGESNPKFQGDWGEMILDKILSSSGLVENEHYFTQTTQVNDENRNLRPDVIVRYPDGREIIIDSKVSLVAYVRYVSALDSESREEALKEHILSVKRHINQLSEKRYEYNNSSLDFVMMFMPVEPAYLLALGSDGALWEYAYKKKIIIVSPTHLITALKLVYDLWSRDAQNKNAIEIARRGALMLDKFTGFVTDMENISKNLDTTRKSYDNAMNKLKNGSGSLVRQAQMLNDLGVRNSKKIKEEV